MRILVIGASRGLGAEFVRQYREAGAEVVATARGEEALRRLRDQGAKALALDVADPASVAGLAWQLDGEVFDTAIVNAGVLLGRATAPEAPTLADFDATMRTNVFGPMQLAAVIAPHLAPGGHAVFAVVSSRMGSIGGRSNGASWLYRASKAAANSVWRDVAFALAGKAICVSLHPGWVKTDMGGADADLAPAQSIADLRATLARLAPGRQRPLPEPRRQRTALVRSTCCFPTTTLPCRTRSAATCRPRSRRTPRPGTRATSSRRSSSPAWRRWVATALPCPSAGAVRGWTTWRWR
jgi:NAD(P)-dependent dehydrogenase (short-subunit alcohol dehydrogenase family)